MKKIINGKRYDTKMAEQVASYWNGCSTSDFNNVSEQLYHTKKGAWFLCGEGGALSPYAELREGGNARCGGEDLIPMTPGEAKEWLELHNETDTIEKWFATEIEDA